MHFLFLLFRRRFFLAGAVFMFIPSAGKTDWLAFTLAGGLLTIYTSVMIPRQKADNKR